MGALKTGELEGIAPKDEETFGSVSEGSQTSPERARYMAYVLKFQKMFGLSREQAIDMIEKYGGIDKVIESFQMQTPEKIHENTQSIRQQIEDQRARNASIARQAEEAQ